MITRSVDSSERTTPTASTISGRVSACIVSWNSAADLLGCIGSLHAQTLPPSEVILIDNASDDEGVASVRKAWPETIICELPRNTGFCRAMNLAIAKSRGEFVLTVNPDCRLEAGFLVHAVEALCGDSRIGSVAGKLLRFDGREPTGHESIIDSAGLALSWTGRMVNRGEGDVDAGRHDRRVDVFGATAAAALYRRYALDSVMQAHEAPFDERFVAYKEDADLAWRLRRARWRCAYEPLAIAFHRRRWRRGRRLEMPEAIRRLSLRNRWVLLAKHESFARFAISLPALAAAEFAVLLWVLARERALLGAYPEGIRLVVSTLKKRWSRTPGVARRSGRHVVFSNADSSGIGR